MTDNKRNPENFEPLFTVSDEVKKGLEGIEARIARSERIMADFKDLGFDTSREEERVKWAKKALEKIRKYVNE